MSFPEDFRLISYLSRLEHAVRFPLSSSYPESMDLDTLFELAGKEHRAPFMQTMLDYPPLRGTPALLDAIASTYQKITAQDIISFAGADEAIYASFQMLLKSGDHAVVITPNYQSLESVPLSLCDVSGVALDADNDWALDTGKIRDALRPNTKVLVINFPHNPTGALISRAQLDELIDLCRERGIWIFSDEVYRLTEFDPADRLPQLADIYERGISLNVTSKAYGLPGLRIGWVACQDKTWMLELERMKQYLSICNSMPGEVLTTIALNARIPILERVMERSRRRLASLTAFLARYPHLFQLSLPKAGVLTFVRYTGAEGAEAFATQLVQQAGVMVIPSVAYGSALNAVSEDFLRIGFGRENLDEALGEMGKWLDKQ
ncbi:pyridoxal phosphate-dependent aminotransferase [Rahnella sp. C60]|uniref:aminotransferase class I/II-fold pyridoxal phosphate-dependent enzyme n=1 Tax=Rahnella perminowiae TaxID=2816244 RepID=UPI001C26943D|nr:pyridoxal phosphate-dependent aminotransferase [Rahnella perminowiae]MBU9809190.1 pyridoxal phosphate-dependent aminotransferase [Rahnella perminowiae]MBU9814531.1 pyridoxal phosphate-dependent aminotransferase [Rahnella perminowiae]MCX2944161.1 pyridoxal phosphate-dependent aminotransferase [Rahnella perminowiae]